MIARRLIIVAVALLLAVQVVRNAAAAALSGLRPAAASAFWSNHPWVELSKGMTEIGRASRARTPITSASIAMIDDAARKAPLAPEPYLVHGVQAQLSGNGAAAARDFAAAQWRDPRSLPAAYFLAEYYFRSGQPIEGLRQSAILARLSPRGPSSIAPFVAVYAQNSSNWPQMRALFRSEPDIEDQVLAVLGHDASSADAILALADPAHRQPNSEWVRQLLHSLVVAGQYGRARSIWASVSGVRLDPAALVFDEGFSNSKPPPPFNWNLTSSTVGLAERQAGNRLHVLFYGQNDGVLASQLLLLPPGNYRLRMTIVPGASTEDALSWSVRCATSDQPFASASLDSAAAHGWTFVLPAACPAQWLELRGRSGDIAQQSEASIGGFHLERISAGA